MSLHNVVHTVITASPHNRSHTPPPHSDLSSFLVSITIFSSFLSIGTTPPAEHLNHVQVMDSRVEGITATTATTTIKAPDHPPLSIGAGLPPVPHKMVARIQRGEFVDMVELLLDRLDCTFGSTPEDKTTAKFKKQSVTNILQWIKCFGIYMVVIAKSQPDRTPDLLG